MLSEFLIISLAVLVFVFLMMLGWSISSYNGFISLRQDIKTQFSNIKTEYQRRIDLIVNLVSTVKSFKKHEKETLLGVVKARSQGFTGNVKTDMKKMKGLDGLFSKLLAISERYPELKAGEQHNKLMDELRVTEDRINIARTDYNGVIRSYNIMIKSFPTNIIAGMFSFKIDEYFKGQDGIEKAPIIELN